MSIEIEKKFRLTKKQREAVLARLSALGAQLKATEFEENTLYGGEQIDLSRSVLRLRRVGQRANPYLQREISYHLFDQTSAGGRN